MSNRDCHHAQPIKFEANSPRDHQQITFHGIACSGHVVRNSDNVLRGCWTVMQGTHAHIWKHSELAGTISRRHARCRPAARLHLIWRLLALPQWQRRRRSAAPLRPWPGAQPAAKPTAACWRLLPAVTFRCCLCPLLSSTPPGLVMPTGTRHNQSPVLQFKERSEAWYHSIT